MEKLVDQLRIIRADLQSAKQEQENLQYKLTELEEKQRVLEFQEKMVVDKLLKSVGA